MRTEEKENTLVKYFAERKMEKQNIYSKWTAV